MFSYIVLAASFLKWAWNFLLHYSFFSSHPSLDLPETLQELSLCYYDERNPPGQNDSLEECAVCLSRFQHGEEIRELRCNHVFHRACLDSWLLCKCARCPLCRDFIAPRRTVTEPGPEVFVFKYSSSFCSNDDRQTWWLR
ncbi:hypothetical protein P3X46_023096 [Hevea brasiliensis]|uniref:RING-type domain-containing protein n=1 Tax=Hevea brasiliensis TaxID=3981 RepID=A0ABQ9LA05_HEVBR|nr:hypothetical protein P3X46_023096 [Hevea brasiliensis]